MLLNSFKVLCMMFSLTGNYSACELKYVVLIVFFQSKQACIRVASVNGVCKSAVNESADNGRKIGSALSPKSAVRLFADRLTTFEQQEVYSYPQIYYVGVSLSCKRINSDSVNNNGFDDDEHAYKVRVHDHIIYRYEILKVIGKGSFGQVRNLYYAVIIRP